jgi:uncharacterized protein YyaL (SSP411 family)
LYDNGQLISLYANAYKLTRTELYKEIIEKTLTFVENEWLTAEGSFYAALDADSLTSENHLEEGAFYVWTIPELEVLLQDDFELFSNVFNINAFGHWEHGNYVLIQTESLSEIALARSITAADLGKKKKKWERTLYLERAKRSTPRLDDKCVTSWNAMMLKGYVDAYKALGEKRYLDIALKNAHFLLNNLWGSEGNLYRTYKNGKASINGYLEDYAHVIQAFISLYQATLDESWLSNARQLTDYCFDFFYDEKTTFFAFTSKNDSALITPHFEIEDNVIPAANSVMANNLYYLSIYFNHNYYETIAQQMVADVFPMIDYPSVYSNWLTLFMNLSEQNKELAICGEDALSYAKKTNQNYWPNIALAGTTVASKLPFLEHRFSENQLLFYLCNHKTCDLPDTNFEEITRKTTIEL